MVRVLAGGALRGTDRKEYRALCKMLVARQPPRNEKEIGTAILAIMEKDVKEHISTLPEPDQPALLERIHLFFSSARETNDQSVIVINVISLQLVILFTVYFLGNTNPEEDENVLSTFVDTYLLYQYIIQSGDEWMFYEGMKKLFEPPNEEDERYGLFASTTIRYLIHPPQNGQRFLCVLGYLTLHELVESYLDDVFFISVEYDAHYTDGDLYNPLANLSHDFFHYDMQQSCYNFPFHRRVWKTFYTFVRSHEWDVDPVENMAIRYSVAFVLFMVMHEDYCYLKKNTIKSDLLDRATPEHVYNYLERYMDALSDLNNLGKSIPVAYRSMVNDQQLDPDGVDTYLKLAAKRYTHCWKIYRQQVPRRGGQRKGKTVSHRRHPRRVTRRK